jgi:hypothetical protein
VSSIAQINSGQLTATASVEHALVLAMFVERAAKLQLMAMSAGTILPVDPALAQEAHDYRHEPKAIGARFAYYSRRVLKQECDRPRLTIETPVGRTGPRQEEQTPALVVVGGGHGQ